MYFQNIYLFIVAEYFFFNATTIFFKFPLIKGEFLPERCEFVLKKNCIYLIENSIIIKCGVQILDTKYGKIERAPQFKYLWEILEPMG